ncbi:hypothetical protein ACWERV_17265 [Streptomyces sp. NPDC004031]
MSTATRTVMVHTLYAASDLIEARSDLPAPYIEVSPRRPDTINVSVHGGFGDFEAWRVALHIPIKDVRFNNGASNAYLSALGSFSGATVQLTGYSSPVVTR